MAFTSLPASIYAVGKAVVKNIFQIIGDDLDDLNTRVSSVEALNNKKVFWNGTVRGASSFTVGTNAARLRIESAIDMTDVILGIRDEVTGGITTGTLEIDIIKATGPAGAADFTTSVSVFTTKPSIDFSTASDYDESSNMILSVTNSVLLEGQYIQINVVSKPAELGRFFFYVIGEAS